MRWRVPVHVSAAAAAAEEEAAVYVGKVEALAVEVSAAVAAVAPAVVRTWNASCSSWALPWSLPRRLALSYVFFVWMIYNTRPNSQP